METQVLPKKQKDSGKHLHLALFETRAVQRQEKQETDYYLEWVRDNSKHPPQKLSIPKKTALLTFHSNLKVLLSMHSKRVSWASS